ncbi:integral membrane protein domain protein [gut metagenome]|uniref:Integral membrane protein domain protein n=1 Tax=gut metagenome TaxID=749906 RepID=J9GJF3_9ZZZZ
MRHTLIDNKIALTIRESVSALFYAIFVLPAFGCWSGVIEVFPSSAGLGIATCALIGTASYLFYYLAIRTIGAARAMALNISYSAWAFIVSIFVFGTMPTVTEWILCFLIMLGTIFAACKPQDLFRFYRHP